MPQQSNSKLNPELATQLKTIVDTFDKEDRATRERQVRKMRMMKLYWNNLSRIYWSDTAKDYRIATQQDLADDQAYYDRPINIFKAFLETIIAALSIKVPAAVCVPNDIDNPMDILTAKGGDKIGELLYKQNNVIQLWINALYVYCTEISIATYTYPHTDKKYGTHEEDVTKKVKQPAKLCTFCNEIIPDETFDQGPEELDELELATTEPDTEMIRCPECQNLVPRNIEPSEIEVDQIVGTEQKPNSSVCIEIWGGLYVKIANYAKKQEDTPYLMHEYETHFANVLEIYPELWDKISKHSNATDTYDQYARLNPQYKNEQPIDNVTVRNVWLRPAAYNVLTKEQAEAMHEKFPDGVRVILANEYVCEYYADKLDDYWTIARNPLADYLTGEPLGDLLVNVQDIINDLISLSLQIIEHGVPQIWANPAIVNFSAQRQLEVLPGTVTPTKPQGENKNISDGFFATTPSSISAELFSFFRIMQELGQFVSGALPSLFGGAQTQGSETASEYAMSRSMALQRLQTPWKMLNLLWKDTFKKSIMLYIKNMKSDTNYVKRDPQADRSFINVFIRKAELAGKIGDVELEASDKMPVSDEDQAKIIMELFALNNMEIMQALTSPENLPLVRKIVKIPEFRMPGEDDRQKQYEEINQILNGEPVMVDELVDDHQVEAEICRTWAISEAGRLTKVENPEGYMMVLVHMKEHMDIAAAAMMQQQAQAMAMAEASSGKPNGSGKPGKDDNSVDGESDVHVPVQ